MAEIFKLAMVEVTEVPDLKNEATKLTKKRLALRPSGPRRTGVASLLRFLR